MNKLGPDREIFNQKYGFYSNMLYRISMSYLKNHANAEEVIQEVFIKLFYKAPTFDTTESERSWIIKVTINLCKDKLRNSWNKKVLPTEIPEDVCASQETNEVFLLIQGLPEKYRTAIVLNCIEGFTIEEISKTLGVSSSAIKMRLKRGKELLKVEMGDDKYEK